MQFAFENAEGFWSHSRAQGSFTKLRPQDCPRIEQAVTSWMARAYASVRSLHNPINNINCPSLDLYSEENLMCDGGNEGGQVGVFLAFVACGSL